MWSGGKVAITSKNYLSIFRDFDAKISIRRDHANDFKTFDVGTYGLCICCGGRINSGLYCRHCDTESETCQECGTSCAETWSVHNTDGSTIRVCLDCRDENYRRCRECGEYYSFDDMTDVGDGDYVCQDCLSEHYCLCEECDEYYPNDNVGHAINRFGREILICDDCRDAVYVLCDCCEEFVHEDRIRTVHGDDCELSVCIDCLREHYTVCEKCDEYYPDDVIEDGLCPDCRSGQ